MIFKTNSPSEKEKTDLANECIIDLEKEEDSISKSVQSMLLN